MSKYNAEHREERKEYFRKYRAEHSEERREYMCKYRAEHREEQNKRMRKYLSQDLNRFGVKKCNIRNQSRSYLLSKRAKLPGYEIHHAFGYDDYTKFIYIPKTLHIQIHQLLRDHKISADSDHWMTIRDLVNSCEQYTYISV
jgi:hypothetical protein